MKYLLISFTLALSLVTAFSQGGTGTTPTARYQTVAEMVAATVQNVPANSRLSALVTGRVTANDGGGGLFFFTPAIVTATNLGTVFPSTGVSGRWFRQFDGLVDVKWFGAVGDGATDDYTALENARSSSASGLYFSKPTVSYKVGTGLVLDTSNQQFVGDGQGSLINFVGSGYLFNVGATSAPDSVVFKNLGIVSTNGVWQIGRTNQAYADGNFRDNWVFENIFCQGPGGTNVIASTFTQLHSWTMRNVTFNSFGKMPIFHMTARGTADRVRFNAFQNGPVWTSFGDPGFTGTSGDTLFNVELLGPTVGSGGNSITIDMGEVSLYNCIYEPATPSSTAFLYITANGSLFRETSGIFSASAPNMPTNSIIFADGFASPNFYGTIITVPGYSAISFGTLGAVEDPKAVFIGCSAEFNTLVRAQPLTKYRMFGGTKVTSGTTDALDGEITDKSGMLRIAAKSGYTQTAPTTGTGLEMWYDSVGGLFKSRAYDAGGALYKAFQLDTLGFNFRVGTTSALYITNALAGVFTVDPQTPLHVTGASTTVATILTLDNSDITSNTTRGVGISFTTRDTAGNRKTSAFIEGVTDQVNGNDGHLAFYTRSGNTLSQRWQVGTGGNLLGIGASVVDTTASTLTLGGASTTQVITVPDLAPSANVVLTTAGKGLQIKEGSNARMGQSALVNGTVTVSNTSVTANTEIFLTRRIRAGTTVGTLGVGTVTAGTSFVIESVDLVGTLSADDDSTVNWLLVEPSP